MKGNDREHRQIRLLDWQIRLDWIRLDRQDRQDRSGDQQIGRNIPLNPHEYSITFPVLIFRSYLQQVPEEPTLCARQLRSFSIGEPQGDQIEHTETHVVYECYGIFCAIRVIMKIVVTMLNRSEYDCHCYHITNYSDYYYLTVVTIVVVRILYTYTYILYI